MKVEKAIKRANNERIKFESIVDDIRVAILEQYGGGGEYIS